MTRELAERVTCGLAAELAPASVAVNALAPVAAAITPGVEALGVQMWIEASMIEPVEAMAEATLALACCAPEQTGRVTYSHRLLEEWGHEIRTLDGTTPYCADREGCPALAASPRGESRWIRKDFGACTT